MTLDRADTYLNDVIKHKNAVAFRRFDTGIGHHAQGHILHAPANAVCWPESACKAWLNIIANAKANAEVFNLFNNINPIVKRFRTRKSNHQAFTSS